MPEDSTTDHSKELSTVSTGGEHSSTLGTIPEDEEYCRMSVPAIRLRLPLTYPGADILRSSVIIPEASIHRTIEEANRHSCRFCRDGAAPENSERGYEQSEGDSRTAGSQDYDVVEDQEQKPRTSREDDQAKLNRRLKEDAQMKREIAARVPKTEGRTDKMGARLLRRFKGGSKR
jgi:hypothetical protein